jgi:FO synthase
MTTSAADVPTSHALRRALSRAAAAKPLDAAEAEVLLHARGEDLQRLQAAASRVRDLGLEAAGRPATVTYSRKVFIPLTRLCRDRCHYCTFATTPGRLPAPFLSPDEVLAIARSGAAAGCKEALFTLGDRPEGRWPQAQQWLDEAGYSSTLEYVRAMAVRVLEETGLLPHLNPGVMSWSELHRLKAVAPSMGLMLETTAEVAAHRGSPDKKPAVRLRCIEDAGRLGIAMTTGILVGIGETGADRVESLFALRRLSRQYRHVQEVIVQNFRAKPDTAMGGAPDVPLDDYLATLCVARLILGAHVRLQAPPNLVDLSDVASLIASGVDDFGGVSPVTPDHVNPERPWPQIDALASTVAGAGFLLRERLTAHPPYLREPWLDPRLKRHVEALRGPDGLAAPDAAAAGMPWQEPDPNWGADDTGRHDLHSTIDTEGRRSDRRGDFDAAYGDWDTLREAVAARPLSAVPASRLSSDARAALRQAESDPAGLCDRDAVVLASAEGPTLVALTDIADRLRRDTVGDEVTYVVNRNINFTNICYTGCRFCAFAQRRSDPDAYSLSLDEVADRAQQAWDAGATEICMQGGIDPALPGDAYFALARAIKARVPRIHLHAYSPMEVMNGSARTGLSVREFLIAAKEAGVDSLPGTAAEILDDDIRWILTKGKLPTAQWVDVVTTAHEVGLPTTSTMMYGHVDEPRHWVAHLRLLAQIQERSGGFTEFVPLPFVHHNAPIYLAGVARPGPTAAQNQAVHALARLLLPGRVPNIQTSWVKLGPAGAALMLRSGANDLGGTLMEETISRMAGSEHGSSMTADQLQDIARAADRTPRQRATDYRPVASPPATRRRQLPLAHA